MTRHCPKRLQSNDALYMADNDIRRARLEEDAERILEDALHRRRWIAKDRDAILAELIRIIDREQRLTREVAV